jgi:hypothetical protein
LSNDGKSLWADVELIGKDAPRIAASNGVSIYAEPEWQDTHGNKHQWPHGQFHELLSLAAASPDSVVVIRGIAGNTSTIIDSLCRQSRSEHGWNIALTKPPLPKISRR